MLLGVRIQLAWHTRHHRHRELVNHEDLLKETCLRSTKKEPATPGSYALPRVNIVFAAIKKAVDVRPGSPAEERRKGKH